MFSVAFNKATTALYWSVCYLSVRFRATISSIKFNLIKTAIIFQYITGVSKFSLWIRVYNCILYNEKSYGFMMTIRAINCIYNYLQLWSLHKNKFKLITLIILLLLFFLVLKIIVYLCRTLRAFHQATQFWQSW